MPGAQVIDLSPIPRTEETVLEKTLGGFIKRQKENKETDALRDIYDKYRKEGGMLEEALIDVQTHPGLSPTARVNAAKQIIDFQKHNNQLQKQAKADAEKEEKKAQQSIIAKDLQANRNFTPEQAEAYAANPALLDKVHPKEKASVGGLSGIPLSPEESKVIETVLLENPNASAEQLEVAFNKAGIAPGRTSKLLESRRRIQEQTAKSKEEERKLTRKEELEFHRESQKYDEELTKSAKIAKNQEHTLKTIENAIKSGNIKPNSIANIFKGFGTIGDKISNAALNGDQATLQASIPSLLEGWKEVFGVRLSDADLRILQDKLPGLGNSLEANKAILKIMKKYSKMALLRSKIGSDLKDQNKGLRPLNYANKIEQRFDEMTAPVAIISPRTGKRIEIPAYEIGDAIDSGARLADE